MVIEDIEYFTKLLKGLIEASNKESEEFELIEGLKKLDISKSSEIIFDLFNIEANSASILKKLYTELEEDTNSEEVYSRKIDMESSLLNLVDDLIYRSRFSLKAGQINYQNIFKAIDLEFDYYKNSIIKRLTEYIKITSELLDKKLFIIVNLDSFLSQKDLDELGSFLCYNEIKLLALQNTIIRQVKSCENLRIIDKDLCEI